MQRQHNLKANGYLYLVMNNMCGVTDYLKSKKRISDMLITMHSTLRDEYHHKALTVAIIVMGGSLWITALAFGSDDLIKNLTPFDIPPKIWIGFISVSVFFLSLIELKIDWKGKANSHQKAAEAYYAVKKQSTSLLLSTEKPNDVEMVEFDKLSDFADSHTVPVPDKRFNELKKKHRIKVEVSKHLDNNPATSLMLFKLRIWFRDNISIKMEGKK